MKITEYKIVCSADTETVEKEVNSLLAQGWEPFGAPLTTGCIHYPSTVYMTQAMVKKESEQ